MLANDANQQKIKGIIRIKLQNCLGQWLAYLTVCENIEITHKYFACYRKKIIFFDL